MKRKIDGITYIMRDTRSIKELRFCFNQLKNKYPNTKLTFREWLVSYGKIHTTI